MPNNCFIIYGALWEDVSQSRFYVATVHEKKACTYYIKGKSGLDKATIFEVSNGIATITNDINVVPAYAIVFELKR